MYVELSIEKMEEVLSKIEKVLSKIEKGLMYETLDSGKD